MANDRPKEADIKGAFDQYLTLFQKRGLLTKAREDTDRETAAVVATAQGELDAAIAKAEGVKAAAVKAAQDKFNAVAGAAREKAAKAAEAQKAAEEALRLHEEATGLGGLFVKQGQVSRTRV